MKKNFLLIDDESIFNFLNEKIITFAGLASHVQTATSGKEALEVLVSGNTTAPIPDIILVDLDMPYMNGFEFVTAFQKLDLPGKENITVAVLTSSVDASDLARARSLGAHHVLEKPLTEERIKALLE